MELGFWSVYITDELKRHEIELFFASITKKIDVLEHQVHTTEELYRREHESNVKRLEEHYKPLIEEARIKYHELLKKSNGTDDEEQEANYESGYERVEQNLHWELVELDEKLNSLCDLHYKAMVILTYSLFEDEVKKLGALLKKHFNKRISISDFGQQNYIIPARKYFDLVIELDQSELDPYDSKLTHLQKVRNRLVHENGVISEKKQEILTAAKAFKGITIETEENNIHIRLSVLFVSEAIQLIREYFLQLFLLIDRKLGNLFLKQRAQEILSFASYNVSYADVKLEYKPNKKTFYLILIDCFFDANKESLFTVKITVKVRDEDAVTIYVNDKLTTILEVLKLKSSFENKPYILKQLLKCYIPESKLLFDIVFSPKTESFEGVKG